MTKRFLAVVAAGCLVAAAIGIGAFLRRDDDRTNTPRAVIVDQLAATVPNPEFVRTVRLSLESAGYTVDYVPPEDVSVQFYRRLPSFGYDLIILRSHSLQEVYGPAGDRGQELVAVREVDVFTNEPYDRQAHRDEQISDRLTIGRYADRPDTYFAITPEFVRHEMQGRFGGAMLVLLGCGGLNSTGMAKALVARGISSVVSWDNQVTAEHNDAAGSVLIRHLVADHMAAADAASTTTVEVGRDPVFASALAAFP